MSPLRRGIVLAAVSLFILLGGRDARAEEEDSPVASHPWIGNEAPAFHLSTTAGDSLSLAGLEGKFVVIHFGASW